MRILKILACAVGLHFCISPALAIDSGLWVWSQTATTNSNIDLSGGIDFTEGQAPSSVNDSARALMSEVAKWRDDMAGVAPSNALITTGGTANAQTISTNGSSTALVNGWTMCARIGATNTASATLNVDNLGAKTIQGINGTNLSGGELPINTIQCFTYRQPTDTFQVVGFMPATGGIEFDTTTGGYKRSAITGDISCSAGSNSCSIGSKKVTTGMIADGAVGVAQLALSVAGGSIRVGTVIDFLSSTCPTGYIDGYGQLIDNTTYNELCTLVSTTYGAGDASHCRMPDLRGRVVIGEDDAGGVSADRITTTLNGDTLGATGGEELHTMLLSEMVAHSHGYSGSVSGTTGASGTLSMTGTTDLVEIDVSANTSNNTTQTGGGARVTSIAELRAQAGVSVSGADHTHTFSASYSGTTTSAGSTSPFNNLQPSIVLHKCIYAGV